MKHLGVSLVLTGLGLTVVHVATPAQTGTETPRTSVVTGRVFDEDTGTPLAGVEVLCRPASAVLTDANGAYRIAGLPVGKFTVQVGGTATLGMPTMPRPVTLSANATVANVDFRVRMPGEVSGRVTDETGQPVIGARVMIVTREYSRLSGSGPHTEYGIGGLSSRALGTGSVTDDRGEYLIKGVGAGRPYRLLAYRPKSYERPVEQVVNPRLAHGVLVPSYYPESDTFDTAMPLSFRSLERRTGVDVRMRRAAPRCASGLLTYGGQPATLEFSVEEEDIARLQDFNILSNSGRVAGRTGQDGRFKVCDLHAGRFRMVIANEFGQSSSQARPRGAAQFEIGNEDLEGIAINATDPVQLEGEVVMEDGGDLQPIARAIAIRTMPASARRQPVTSSGKVQFAFAIMPTVNYALNISGLSFPYYVNDVTVDYGGGPTSHLRKYIATDENNRSATLQVRVRGDAGALSVEVTGADGKAIPGNWVMLTPFDAGDAADVARGLILIVTNDVGVADAPALKPGKYNVVAPAQTLPGIVVLPTDTQFVDLTPEALDTIMKWRAAGRVVEVGARSRVRVTVTRR